MTKDTPAPYGYCPTCGGLGLSRERRPNGNDRCENGHEYPSRSSVTSTLTFSPAESEDLRLEVQRLRSINERLESQIDGAGLVGFAVLAERERADRAEAELRDLRAKSSTCSWCGQTVIPGQGGHTSACYERQITGLKAELDACGVGNLGLSILAKRAEEKNERLQERLTQIEKANVDRWQEGYVAAERQIISWLREFNSQITDDAIATIERGEHRAKERE